MYPIAKIRTLTGANGSCGDKLGTSKDTFWGLGAVVNDEER